MRVLAAVIGSLFIGPFGIAAGDLSAVCQVHDDHAIELVSYHRMLAAYEVGNDAASLDLLASWNIKRVSEALGLVRSADDRFREWEPKRYRQASMLHADVALLKSGGVGTRKAQAHLQIAARLLAIGSRDDGVRAFASRWFEAVSRYLRDAEAVLQAEEILTDAREWLKDDARLLYESGTLAEVLATDYALSDAQPPEPLLNGEWHERDRLESQRERRLKDAERWLREALKLQPANEKTRLHLGRVQGLQLEDADALQMLGEVMKNSDDGSTRYLAAMFSGAIHDRNQDLPQAEATYRTATTYVPTAHAGHIALSEVLMRMGKIEKAQVVLDNLMAIPLRNLEDPRWYYLFDPPGSASRRLESLRREVRR